jgi:autotransporter-associated beta strand protein
VGGLSPDGLILSAINIGAGGGITKTGTGGLVLSGASTFTGGVALQNGSIILNADSTPSTVGATVTAGPLGTGTLTITDGAKLVSGVAIRVNANAISANNQLIFGTSAFGTTLNGTVTFAAVTPTITVENAFQGNSAISSTLGQSFGGTNITGFVKNGPGTLIMNATSNARLTSGGTNVTVNDGILQVAQQYALGGSNYTAGSTVVLNGGGYNNAITNVFVQNPVSITGSGVLSATAASTAIGAVTMGSTGTTLGDFLRADDFSKISPDLVERERVPHAA